MWRPLSSLATRMLIHPNSNRMSSQAPLCWIIKQATLGASQRQSWLKTPIMSTQTTPSMATTKIEIAVSTTSLMHLSLVLQELDGHTTISTTLQSSSTRSHRTIQEWPSNILEITRCAWATTAWEETLFTWVIINCKSRAGSSTTKTLESVKRSSMLVH